MPLEDDGTLLLTTPTAQFPDAIGPRYQNETRTFRDIRLVSQKLHPSPEDSTWGETIYMVVSQTKLPVEESSTQNEITALQEEIRVPIERKFGRFQGVPKLYDSNVPWRERVGFLKSHY